jgi:hypothetical protein
MQYQLTHCCLIVVLLHLIDVSFTFGFSGNDITRSQLLTASKCCCETNDIKINLNVSAYISPVRLRNIAGDLAGASVRACGWGKTSDS